jgi:hypothetical protein
MKMKTAILRRRSINPIRRRSVDKALCTKKRRSQTLIKQWLCGVSRIFVKILGVLFAMLPVTVYNLFCRWSAPTFAQIETKRMREKNNMKRKGRMVESRFNEESSKSDGTKSKKQLKRGAFVKEVSHRASVTVTPPIIKYGNSSFFFLCDSG